MTEQQDVPFETGKKRRLQKIKNFFEKYQIGVLILILGIGILVLALSFNNSIMGSLGISIITTGVLSQIIKVYFDEQESKIFPIKKDIENVFEKRTETYKIILREMKKSSKIICLVQHTDLFSLKKLIQNPNSIKLSINAIWI
jgi:hypothetical protein